MASRAPLLYVSPLGEPPAYRPRRWLPIALFGATVITAMSVGARLAFNFQRGLPAYRTNTDLFPFLWLWRHPGYIGLGWPFAAALLGILGVHELGHYVACRHYRLAATWPHFIPAPTLIGTLGAFIYIRSPFRTRRQLFDIGVAGPLAGFVLALPLLVLGLAESHVRIFGGGALEFGWPPLMAWVWSWLRPGVPPEAVALSPLARAAWIGLLATMLNLIPSGQLDGGHIFYTFLPRLHRAVSWAMVALMVFMGWRYWDGWYLWAVLLLAMRARHPYVPSDQTVGRGRAVLALVALAILVMTFIPAPFIFR
ncbi:MAG: site-2 protease family protein [Terriglobales bacterium]